LNNSPWGAGRSAVARGNPALSPGVGTLAAAVGLSGRECSTVIVPTPSGTGIRPSSRAMKVFPLTRKSQSGPDCGRCAAMHTWMQSSMSPRVNFRSRSPHVARIHARIWDCESAMTSHFFMASVSSEIELSNRREQRANAARRRCNVSGLHDGSFIANPAMPTSCQIRDRVSQCARLRPR